jgi:hypothetical protein
LRQGKRIAVIRAITQVKGEMDFMTRAKRNIQKTAKSVREQETPLNKLKKNLSLKTVFDILDDVQKVNPEQWKNPSQVEKLARNLANKLGLTVSEQRFKQFLNAYKDATKNGPTMNVDDMIQKYGKNVDEKTAKEIKNLFRM